MKANTVLAVAVSVAVFLLAGCGTAVRQETGAKKLSELQAQDKAKETVGYEIVKKVSENKANHSKIFYPQISGYKGQLLMDYMNQSLKKIEELYGKGETFKDVSIDYRIAKMDKDILSVVFKGTGKILGSKEINILQSVNLDMKTSNTIDFNNLIKAESVAAVKTLIIEKAKASGIAMTEFEGVRLYFEGENIVFFYMPADDSATNFIEISIPIKEIKAYMAADFGEKPAS